MPAPLALMAAMMIPGLIPGLGKGIAGIGEGVGSAAKGYGQGVGSAFSGLGKGAGSLASGVGGGIGAGAEGLGKGVGGLAEKGLGAVGDFLFGDDEEDTNYDNMTIDNLEIDTLNIDTANIDKLVIDSKDLGKTDDNKTDNEKLDTKETKETKDNLLSGITETVAPADQTPESQTQEEFLESSMFQDEETEQAPSPLASPIDRSGVDSESLNITKSEISNTNNASQKGTNNANDSIVPNMDTMAESSGLTSNILGGGSSSGGSFADLTVDAGDMTSELGDISETLATPEEGPGFNWEDMKDALGGGGGEGGFMTDAVTAMLTPMTTIVGGLWEGGKDVVGGLWEGAGDLFGFDTASDVEAQENAKAMTAMAEGGGIGDVGIGILESIRDCTCAILDTLGGDSASFLEEDVETSSMPAGIQEDVPEADSLFDTMMSYHPINVISDMLSGPWDDSAEEELTNSTTVLGENADLTEGGSLFDTAMKFNPVNMLKEAIFGKSKKSVNEAGSIPDVGDGRGMKPSYTKEPPAEPMQTNKVIIEEIRSYHQYPAWMWKLG